MLLAAVGVQRLADRHRDIHPDQIDQGQRPHRVVGAERHAAVDVLCLHSGLLHQAHGVEEVGEEQSVDDEARARSAPRPPSCRSPRTRRAPAGRICSPAASGRQSSISSIFATGLKGCSPKTRSGVAALPTRARRARGRRWWSPGRRPPRRRRPCSSRSTFGPSSSTTASTTRSQSARSPATVVTLIRLASAPVDLRRRARGPVPPPSRPRRRSGPEAMTFEATLAQAASPVAIVPLPAIAGRSYVSMPATARCLSASHGCACGVPLGQTRAVSRRRDLQGAEELRDWMREWARTWQSRTGWCPSSTTSRRSGSPRRSTG